MPGSNHPNRYAVLHWFRYVGEVRARFQVHVVVIALVAPAAFPQPSYEVQALVEHLRANSAIELFPRISEAGTNGAQSHGKDGASVGDLVQGDDLTGQLPGAAPGQRCEHGAELDMLRADRHCREQGPGVDAVGCLPDENAVPAVLVGENGMLNL